MEQRESSLNLRHISFWFSKISVTSPTSQLILQSFPRFTYITTHSPTRCFTYVAAHSPTLLSFLCHRIFTYVTWRAAHAFSTFMTVCMREYTLVLRPEGENCVWCDRLGISYCDTCVSFGSEFLIIYSYNDKLPVTSIFSTRNLTLRVLHFFGSVYQFCSSVSD